MHAETMPRSDLISAKPIAKVLATLSAVLFWCLPIAPLLSIAAVKATEQTTGWPRLLAKTGACLTIFWVALMAGAFAWILHIIIWNPSAV